MSNRDEIFKYHELAKDAGNRFRSYILSVSSGATGVFFLVLTAGEEAQCWEDNERSKSKRYRLIHASYCTLGVAICTTSIYLVPAIVRI